MTAWRVSAFALVAVLALTFLALTADASQSGKAATAKATGKPSFKESKRHAEAHAHHKLLSKPKAVLKLPAPSPLFPRPIATFRPNQTTSVQRPQFSKDALSINIRMAPIDSSATELLNVVVNDNTTSNFLPYVKRMDQSRPSTLPGDPTDLTTFEVPDAAEVATFYLYSTDPEMKHKISFSRPSLFSYDRATVTAELAEWPQTFIRVPIIKHGLQSTTAAHLKDAAILNVKLSCGQPGSSRVVVHMNMVPTPDKELAIIYASEKSTESSASAKPAAAPKPAPTESTEPKAEASEESAAKAPETKAAEESTEESAAPAPVKPVAKPPVVAVKPVKQPPKPTASKPVAAKPVATKPAATKPAATKPAAAKPVTITPIKKSTPTTKPVKPVAVPAKPVAKPPVQKPVAKPPSKPAAAKAKAAPPAAAPAAKAKKPAEKPLSGPKRKLLSTAFARRFPSVNLRYHKLMSFSFIKHCFKSHIVAGSPLPGFMISRNAKDNDVVVNGVPTSQYAPNNETGLIELPPKEAATTFYLRIHPDKDTPAFKQLKQITVTRPIVTSQTPEVCTVVTSGELERFRNVVKASKSDDDKLGLALTVTYRCVSDGKAVINVQLPTSHGDVSFAYIKDCTNAKETEGAALKGLSVGTSPDKADVIKNGLTHEKFRSTSNVYEELSKERLVFPPEASSATFYFKMHDDTPQEYQRPLVFSETSSVSSIEKRDATPGVDDANNKPPIVFPTLQGEAMSHHIFQKHPDGKKYLDLIVNFRCLSYGLAEITVKVPLVPSGVLTFSFDKQCDATKYANQTKLEKFLPIPGFDIAEGDTPNNGLEIVPNVVKDGIPLPQFHWAGNSSLHYYNALENLASFVISFQDINKDITPEIAAAAQKSLLKYHAQKAKPKSESGAKEDELDLSEAAKEANKDKAVTVTAVIIEPPTVSSQYKNCEPTLGGQGSTGIILTHKQQHTLSVSFNCISGGTTKVMVALPVTIRKQSFDPDGRPASAPSTRFETIMIAFSKICPYFETTLATSGGIALPGFVIGTTPKGDDVVKDGFPYNAYFGQRTKPEPEWNDVIVPPKNSSVTYYFSYDAVSGDEFVEFQPPSVVSHSPFLSVQLSGDVLKGGKLVRNGTILELDVNFDCKKGGVGGIGSATVSFAVLPKGSISFTIPKNCTGASSPRGVRITNLFIGTAEGHRDVVSNGLTHSKWVYSKKSKKDVRVVDGTVQTSTFYISRPSTRIFFLRDRLKVPPLEIYEPIVFAHRPFCNPSIENSLRHTAIPVIKADKDGKNGTVVWEDAETLQVTNDNDTLKINYNCLWPSVTPITVVIPLVPRGQISFTWLKNCSVEDAAHDSADGFLNILTMGKFKPDAATPPVDVESDWSRWDERHQFDEEYGTYENFERHRLGPEPIPPAAMSEGSAASADPVPPPPISQGFIDIGTGTTEDRRADVVQRKIPKAEYSTPETKAIHHVLATKVFTEATLSTTFYVSVPAYSQEFEAPDVYVETPNVIAPILSGRASTGGTVTKDNPLELKLEFNCVAAGFTSVLISFPLKPTHHGHVSFRVNKICGGFKAQKSYESEWTVTGVVTWAFVIFAVAAAGVVFWRAKSKAAVINRLQTQQRLGASAQQAATEMTEVSPRE